MVAWQSHRVDAEIALQRAIDKARTAGASYVDVRLEQTSGLTLSLKDGAVERAIPLGEGGIGARVLYKGAWGFASTSELTTKAIGRAFERALRLARLSAGEGADPIILAEAPTATVDRKLKVRSAAEDVGIDVKHRLMLEVEAAAREEPLVCTVSQSYQDHQTQTLFLSSDGTRVRSMVPVLLHATSVVVRRGADLNSYRVRTGGTQGWEVFSQKDPRQRAREAAATAVLHLGAKAAPSGRLPVVLDPDLNGVFVHEALGHACEADLVAAGDSCLAGRLGQQVGASSVTIVDDPTLEGLFGSFPIDAEGLAGRRKVLLRQGVLQEYINNRETAGKYHLTPNGGARVESYAFRPLVRMSNTYMQAGDHSFEELLAPIKHGVYAKGTRGGQVDTALGSFQFSAQEAFLIEDGQITSPLSNLALSGATLEILRSVEALGKDLTMSDPGFCGKGQVVDVTDGGPHVRISSAIIGGG